MQGFIRLATHPDVMDAAVRTYEQAGKIYNTYLASFATTSGCRRVSFESSFKQYEALDFLGLNV